MYRQHHERVWRAHACIRNKLRVYFSLTHSNRDVNNVKTGQPPDITHLLFKNSLEEVSIIKAS